MNTKKAVKELSSLSNKNMTAEFWENYSNYRIDPDMSPKRNVLYNNQLLLENLNFLLEEDLSEEEREERVAAELCAIISLFTKHKGFCQMLVDLNKMILADMNRQILKSNLLKSEEVKKIFISLRDRAQLRYKIIKGAVEIAENLK